MDSMSMQAAIDIYVQIAAAAVPIAVAFGICDIIVTSFLRAALGGRVSLSSGVSK